MKKLLIGLFAFILVLSGCSNSDIYTFSIMADLESLDPTNSSYSQTFQLYSDIYSGLTKVNGDLELENAMAEEITASDDGLTYTFKLREDAIWSDNTGEEMGPVTANDFVFGWQRMVDPNVASSYAYIFDVIENGSKVSSGELPIEEFGVTAIDDYTLEVKLEYPAPYFTSMLSFGVFSPQPEGAYEMYGDDFASSEDTMWYNGAYYVSSFDPAFETIIEKAPLYYNADSVQVESIKYKVNTDSQAAINAFDAGELNYTEVQNSEEYDTRIADGTVKDSATGYTFYAVLNTSENSVTSNENLRKAIAYGFDRDVLLEGVYGDIHQPIEYIIPSGITPSAYDGIEYRDYSDDSLITYNPDLANEYFDKYMEEMGYSDRSQIEIELLSSDSTGNTNINETLKALYEQEFGITILTTVQPFEQYVESRNSGAFDITITGWGPDYADPSTYLSLWTTTNIGSLNFASYSNPKYDELYSEALLETDVDKRFTEFAELEKMLVDEAVLVPFYQKNAPYLLTDGYTQPVHTFLKVSHEYTTYTETE